jgi:anaerobic magnesium-protoporphyrin IX monomethyl ester cyclase
VDYVNLFQDEKTALADKLQRNDVLTVAVTTTLYVGPWWIEEIVSFVRQHTRKARLIIGGPYIHNQSVLMTPEQLSDLFEQLGADVYVISQEGEQALVNVVDALKHRKPLHFVNNIAFRHKGRFVCTPAMVESNSLADNPVDYQMFPPEQIGQFVTVRTAKSCPFGCAFCGFPQRAGKYTYEPVDLVERELDAVGRIGGITTLTFIDDTFNVPMKRFKEILRMMIRNEYGFKWNSFLRADHVDDECIDLMRDSGCEGVFLGMESGSGRMLKLMNKTSRPEHYRRIIPLLRRAGIVTHCNLIVGFPGETDESVRETIDLIEDVQPDLYRAQLWYCDPTTPVWTRREELGITGSAFSWRHPTMDSTTAATIVESMFREVRGALWLPQQGFELWSVFYLQRQGMSLTQLKTYLRSFNAAVERKLRAGTETKADVDTVRTLAESSRILAA